MDADLTAALAAPFTLDANPGRKPAAFPDRAGRALESRIKI